MQQFAQRLCQLMNEGGVSQYTLGKTIGVTRQSIAQYLDGNTQPNAEKICAIADFFDVSTDYLLGRTECKKADIETQAICKITNLTQEALSAMLDETFQRFDDRPYHKIDTLNLLLENRCFQAALSAVCMSLLLTLSNWEESSQETGKIEGKHTVLLTGKFAGEFYKTRALEFMNEAITDLMMEAENKNVKT